MRKKATTKELSACETLIMKVVWEHTDEDIAVQDLIVELREQYGKNYARTTVVTFLHKMAEKGFVSTYRVGNASFVHAEQDEEAYRTQLMQNATEFWFDGQATDAMSAILNKKDITSDEIQKMRELLDELDNILDATN